MANYTKLQDLDIRGKRVFVRVDFNVPFRRDANNAVEITNTSRIDGALETIKYIISNEGKCILASHLGRPKGQRNPEYSLEPVGEKLSELLNQDVLFSSEAVGDGPRSLSQQLRSSQVLLLENVRFYKGETKNSSDFAHELGELCDVYVGDAFGTLHRAHASTTGVPALKTEKGIGLLVQKELNYLAPLRQNPEQPFVLIMGGAKVSDKIGALESLFDKVNTVIIGGAMAYSFLRAQGKEIGRSLCEIDQVRLAERLLKGAAARKVTILLPQDHMVAESIDAPEGTLTEGPDIPTDLMGVDIGPKSVEVFKVALDTAKTVFWNGPMGVFEKAAFAKGTFALAEVIAASSAQKLAGGGDVVAAIDKSGYRDQFDFISTGGGATLEYLEGKPLPGLQALEAPWRAPVPEGDDIG